MNDRIYTNEYLTRFKHDYNPRDIPNEIRNFRTFLNKCPQLATSLQLVTEADDGIIKLNSSLIDPTVAVLRKLTGVLNRMTATNYDNMMKEVKRFQRLPNDNVTMAIMNVLVQNIKLSEGFIRLYASMTKEVDEFNDWQLGRSSFSRQLSQKCLQEFDAFQQVTARESLKEEIINIKDPDDRNDREARIKRENKAVVMFLAHLYLQGVVVDTEVLQMIDRLLSPLSGEDKIDDYNLDYFMAMYPIAGVKLGKHDRSSTQRIHRQVSNLLNVGLSFRLKFMLQDFMRQQRIPILPAANTRA